MVIKKFFIIILLISNFAVSSEILDYETELLINDLINDIREVNNINKNINFKILSNDNINAFVNENNLIHVTSGLIEYCPDYVALLSVLAHEIGHIDKNHISIRKSSIGKINSLKNISSLSIIAGSMISRNPEILQSVALSSASVSNLYINFSKEQEVEADYYSLETLKKLNVKSISIIELLKIIEKKALEKGLTKEKQKFSSHPYFEERINIATFLGQDKKKNLDLDVENRFKFIKAKFLGYSENISEIEKQEELFKDYSISILNAKRGKLSESLQKINELISLHPSNISLLETKGDILFSYGYTNESVKFYKIVFEKQPLNKYTQIRIFTNTETSELNTEELNNIFLNNLNLLFQYFNNKNILKNYLKLSKKLNKNEWIEFIKYWINKNPNNQELIKENLEIFIETKDKDLYKLINLIYSNYK